MSDGYGVDPAALDMIAGGIRDVVVELDGLGIAGSGDAGLGFGGVALTRTQLGHAGLTDTLDEFTDRWGWAVQGLVSTANDMAAKLGLAAGAYHDQETYAEGVLKVAANDLVGDPHRPEQEVTGSTWSQLVDHSVDQLTHPDWVGDSARTSLEHAATVWTKRPDGG